MMMITVNDPSAHDLIRRVRDLWDITSPFYLVYGFPPVNALAEHRMLSSYGLYDGASIEVVLQDPVRPWLPLPLVDSDKVKDEEERILLKIARKLAQRAEKDSTVVRRIDGEYPIHGDRLDLSRGVFLFTIKAPPGPYEGAIFRFELQSRPGLRLKLLDPIHHPLFYSPWELDNKQHHPSSCSTSIQPPPRGSVCIIDGLGMPLSQESWGNKRINPMTMLEYIWAQLVLSRDDLLRLGYYVNDDFFNQRLTEWLGDFEGHLQLARHINEAYLLDRWGPTNHYVCAKSFRVEVKQLFLVMHRLGRDAGGSSSLLPVEVILVVCHWLSLLHTRQERESIG
jgi:hypothetical protein